jgi:hypothetical protein
MRRAGGIAALTWIGLLGCQSGPDPSGTSAVDTLLDQGVERAVGDNAGPLFTGETRGEYRDRREVERLGEAGFRDRFGRDPDLYWPSMRQ